MRKKMLQNRCCFYIIGTVSMRAVHFLGIIYSSN